MNSPGHGWSVPEDLPTSRIRRAVPTAGLLIRTAGGRALADFRERAGRAGAIDRFHDRNADRYVDVFGRSKGLLMKVAQMVSMLDVADVGGHEFVAYHRKLARLHTEAPSMPLNQVLAVVQSDLGRPVEQVFADFSDVPLATASIGQVHRATLTDGRAVVVKIQYPGVAEAIRADLANGELMLTFGKMAQAGAGIKFPDTRKMAAEVSARIAEELDYRQEAANIDEFHRLYADHPFIRVPQLIPHASGDRVLSMTYLDGMDWSTARQAAPELKNTWAEAIFRFLTGSYRHGTIYHADPHPWNCRFGADGTVGFVDFGCVRRLTETQRGLIVAVGRCALQGQDVALRQLMVDGGFLTADSTYGADDVLGYWQRMFHELLIAQPVTYTADSFDRTMRTVIDVRAPEHPLRHLVIPDEFVMMSRIELSQAVIYSGLDATFHARAALDDMDGVIEPCTPLGHQHHAWRRRRNLPYGLDRHRARETS